MQKKSSKRLLSIFTAVLMIAGIIAGTISVNACEYCDASKNESYTSQSRSLYADPCDLPEGITYEYIEANGLCLEKCLMDYLRSTTWNIGKDNPTDATARFIPDDPDDIFSEGTLLVEGTGATKDFITPPDYEFGIRTMPWRNAVKYFINKVVIGEGITSIGIGTFRETKQLTQVVLPNTLTTLDAYAFSDCDSLTDINFPDNLVNVCESTFGGTTLELQNIVSEKFPNMFEGTFTKPDYTSDNTVDDTSEATQNTDPVVQSTTAAPSIKPIANTAVINTYTAVKTDVKSTSTVKQAKITSVKIKNVADNKISVKWNKVDNAKKYKVQVSKTKKFKKLIVNKIVKKKKVNIKNNKLKTGKTYYVRVKPYYNNKTWGTWKKSKITIA